MGLSIDGVNINRVIIDGVVCNRVVYEGNLILAPPTITKQPVNGSVNNLQTYNLSVVANSLGGDLKYQWYRNGAIIPGATASTYRHPASAVGSYTYYCIVSNGCGQVQSSTARVTVVASWTATHNITVGYWTSGQYFSIWGYSRGNTGAVSPGSFDGKTINSMGGTLESGTTRRVTCATAGETPGRVYRMESENNVHSAQATTTAGFGTTQWNVTNTAFQQWFQGKVGQVARVRMTRIS